ncbi:MAG: hypothetical protein ABIB61_03920 [Candidatus Shapirobacteria bacterium]
MTEPRSLTKIIIGFGKIWLKPKRSKGIRIILILIALQILTIVYFFTKLPPQIPLYFSLPWGESQLTSSFSLLLLPLFSLIVLFFNLFLASSLIENSDFLADFLIIGSLIFSLFSLMAILESINLAL